MITFQQFLNEKLIVLNRGKRSGQVVFLAGGGGSGKGFVVKHLMDATSYKSINPDDMKTALMKLGKRGVQGFEQFADKDLKKPEDIHALHLVAKDKNYFGRVVGGILGQKRSELPNLLFDRTMKSEADYMEVLPALLNAGYQPDDIHVVWVLTDYKVALKLNATRARVVPEDILLQAHGDVAKSMKRFILDSYHPPAINGDIVVVLGGPANTIHAINQNGERMDGKDGRPLVIKDFVYLKVKEAGKPYVPNDFVTKQLLAWIHNLTPYSDD